MISLLKRGVARTKIELGIHCTEEVIEGSEYLKKVNMMCAEARNFFVILDFFHKVWEL